MEGQFEGRCGKCLFAQDIDDPGKVECRGGLPTVQMGMALQGGEPKPITITMGFPRMSALDGFCRFYEPGKPVPYSRILKVGAGAMPVGK